MQTPETDQSALSEEQVIAFLQKHPDFLKRHPEMLALLTPPGRELGESVVDFQQFQLKNLQSNTRAMKTRYDSLVDFCRDNLSVQGQVHDAALRLIRARNLEQLLEVITIDLVSLFDVDVVRLAVESDAAEFYETYYTEQNYSGIVFITPGACDVLFEKRKAILVEDTVAKPPVGFDEIFADCSGLIQSCALLKLELELINRDVLLAFGVRTKKRFHAGQGLELLSFLSRIVAHQLDAYLTDMAL